MSETIGNDGLTSSEREELAERYLQGPGRKSLSPLEYQAARDWLDAQRAKKQK